MTDAFIMSPAPAPPAPAAPPAARDAPSASSGSTFKQALAAAQQPGAEKPADSPASPQPAAPAANSRAADPVADAIDPLKQALLEALAALLLPAAQAQPVTQATPAAGSQPAPSQAAAAVSAQASAMAAGPQPQQLVAALEMPAQASSVAAQTAAPTPQPTDQDQAKGDPQKAAPQAFLIPAESLPVRAQAAKPADDASALTQALADRLKVAVEKPPAASPPELAAVPLAAGLAKAAGPDLSELARSAEAPLTNGLPLVNQIQQGLETLAKAGQTSVRLQLYPESLGRVDMHLTSGADGVRVSLTANLAATGSLLERHADELRRALTDSGLTVAGLSINFNLGQGQPSNSFEWHPSTGTWGPASGAAAAADPGADDVSAAVSPELGRVDYLI